MIETKEPDQIAVKPEKAPEPKLSPEQDRIVEAVLSGQNMLVTGSAGTGKSTILKAIQAKKPLPVTASTGIAAVQVSGTTIHSWAGIGLADRPARDINRELGKAAYNRICEASRIAIDEISMLSARTFGLIDELFRIVRKNEQPFGGVQIVAFGDFLQLPPVVKTQEEARTLFAFQSPAWRGFRVGILQKVFRQADQEFADALNDIRVGRLSERALQMLRSRFQPDDPNPDIVPVIVHTHNRDVETENLAALEKLPEPEQKYEALDSGSNGGALAALQKNCLAPTTLRLRVDAQVMLLKNIDPARGLANGSIGKVIKFAKFGNMPVVRFADGQEIEMEPDKWEIKQDGEVVAERKQVPLRLAWAITAHKSQGMSLDKIAVHLGRVFEFGQAYVALSRARTQGGLFIRDGGRQSIKAHPEALRFYGEQQPI